MASSAERVRLSDALALAAQPRSREYAIHDATLRCFMLRVQPDGSRFWVLRFRRDDKPRRVTLGTVTGLLDCQIERRGWYVSGRVCRAACAVGWS